jgi:hypothetical protein
MKRIILAALVGVFCIPNNSFAAAPLDANLKACVSGLKAVENYVRGNKPELNPDYFRALYGWEAFKAHTKSFNQLASVPPSSMSDIKYCSHYNLAGAEINFLMGHVYGFASDNPEDELT